jgi:hypothetical protein
MNAAQNVDAIGFREGNKVTSKPWSDEIKVGFALQAHLTLAELYRMHFSKIW